MGLIKKFFQQNSLQYYLLHILHLFNDGYFASYFLLFPFIATSFHISLAEVGILGTFVNSFRLVGALPAAYIAAKFGGIKTLLLCLLIYGLGFTSTGFVQNFFWLFPTGILIGLGLSIFHPIGFTLIAKWSTEKNRGRNMGNFTAIGDVGRIGLAALFTFLIAFIGWKYTVILYGFIAIVFAAVFYLIFIKKSEHIVLSEKKYTPVKMKEILKQKKFLCAVGASFLDTFANSSLFIFLPFLLLHRGINPALLGTFTAAFFIGTFVGKTSLGRFVDKFGSVKVFILSEFLMAIFIFSLANATLLPLIILFSILLGIFTKGTVPVVQTMISESATNHGNYEKTFSISAVFENTAQTITPILLGVVSDAFGIIFAFNVMAIAALLATIPAMAFQKLKKY